MLYSEYDKPKGDFHKIFLENFINEAYIGKTDTLLEIEEQIGVVREKALKKFTDINKSPEVLKLNRLFEKQFGMECFCLTIEQESTVNAFTSVIQTRFDIAFQKNISKYIEGDNIKGFRWKPNNGLCICVNMYLGLLQDESFTNGELLAVILHEIGHNFADAIYDDIKYDNMQYMYFYGYALLIKTLLTFGLRLPKTIHQYLNLNNAHRMKKAKSTVKNPFRGLFTGLNASRKDAKSFIKEVRARLKGGKSFANYKLYADQYNVKEHMKKTLDRQNEVIADKFAGIYGYGPEQTSSLLKMHDYKSKAEIFTEKIPLIGKKANEMFNINYIDLNDYNIHPNVIQRAHEEIKLLRREMAKTDCDPKLKKEMEKQVDAIEQIINDSMKVTKDSSEYEKRRAEYYKLVNNEYPDAITNELEDAIEEAFDKALNGGNKNEV